MKQKQEKSVGVNYYSNKGDKIFGKIINSMVHS